MASPLIDSVEAKPKQPGLTKVRVLWYEDGSVRFRVYRTPLVIEEAFLTGNAQGHSIVKLTPR